MTKISSKLYAETLYQICQETKNVDLAVQNFIKILAKHNKLSLGKKIIRDFVRFYNKKTNTVDVDLETAYEIKPGDYESIISLAKNISQAKNVEIKQKINPGLIGGAIINIGDCQIDTTIKNKLNKLNN